MRLFAATGDDVARLSQRDGRWEPELVLAGRAVQCVAVDPNDGATVLAGSRGGGVLVSDDVFWNLAFWIFTKRHRVPFRHIGTMGVTRKP